MDFEISGAASVLEIAALYPRSQYLSWPVLKSLLGLLLLHYAVIKCYRMFIYPYWFSPLRHLPGPKDHHWPIGQVLNQWRSGSPVEPYVSWVKKWPDAPFIRFMQFGNSETLLVTSIEAHKEVLQTQCYNFHKPAFFQRLIGPIVGIGMAFTEGEEHKRQRRMLNTVFSVANVRAFVPVLQEKARKLCSMYDRAIREEDGVVELVGAYAKLTLDIIGVFSMGMEMNNLDEESEFHTSYKAVFDQPLSGQILLALSVIAPIRWIPVEANRRFNRAASRLHELVLARVRERIAEMKSLSPEDMQLGGEDMLTSMIREKYMNEDDDDRWSEQELMHQLLNIIAAGHETTAGALVWTTHLFTIYPAMYERLRTEALALLASDPDPDYAAIEALPYLNNFTRELMRVWGPAVWAPRETAVDTVVQGIVVPKGTAVLVIPQVMHRNETVWGADCDAFDPDRWEALGERSASPAADVFAYETFIQGPRMCIGRVLALLEYKVAVLELVAAFRFDWIPLEQGGSGGAEKVRFINPGPVLRPKGGLKVRVRRAVD